MPKAMISCMQWLLQVKLTVGNLQGFYQKAWISLKNAISFVATDSKSGHSSVSSPLHHCNRKNTQTTVNKTNSIASVPDPSTQPLGPLLQRWWNRRYVSTLFVDCTYIFHDNYKWCFGGTTPQKWIHMTWWMLGQSFLDNLQVGIRITHSTNGIML